VARFKIFGRLVRSQRGSAALQFALAAPVFLLLLCAVIENGIVLFTQSLLDDAARDGARLIQTGQVQQAGGGPSTFTTQICTEVGSYIPCSSLQYNVQSASTFASLNVTVTANSSGNMTTTGFDAGNPGDNMAVQVGYNRPYLVPWLGNAIGSTHSTLLVSTVIFQNEPFIP
jgi:Flp pilus assembly protein TadG